MIVVVHALRIGHAKGGDRVAKIHVLRRAQDRYPDTEAAESRLAYDLKIERTRGCECSGRRRQCKHLAPDSASAIDVVFQELGLRRPADTVDRAENVLRGRVHGPIHGADRLVDGGRKPAGQVSGDSAQATEPAQPTKALRAGGSAKKRNQPKH